MSVMVYLMRHGIAEEPSRGVADGERALTEEGIRKTTRVAEGLRALDIRPDAILSSPLRRAQETARIAGAVLAPDCAIELTPLLAGEAAPEVIARDLRPSRRASHILLVGHMPDLGDLASYLLTGSAHRAPLPFKKAGVAAIEVDGLPPKGPGLLHWFATPALLRGAGQK
jgi:phosphohistidine phosphatase